MRTHPRLISALAITATLLILVVPSALAANGNGNGNGNGNANAAAAKNGPLPGNCGHGACTTTATIVTTQTTYPFATTTITERQRICNPNGATRPPCGRFKSAEAESGTGISVGATLAVLGILFLGYLGLERRRTIKLDE